AEPFRTAPSSLEALVSDLDRLGFDPVVSDPSPYAGPDASATLARASDAAVVSFAHCPFGDLATEHPDLVCSLHHGLIDGFVQAMGDTEIVEFCSLAARTPCRVTVSSR